MYLATENTTIAMVLVQEEDGIENYIYYLSHNINDIEIKYTYIEKLTLAVVQVVQRFFHYILLRKAIVILDFNPMKYIRSHQLLGGKYSNWIIIF